MPFDVRIPPLGESVTEGVILRWLKHDGDRVRPDDLLLELETDKATMELPAERGGVLRILQPEARALTAARVTLTAAVRIVLRNGLQLLGVQTPDAM